MPVIENIPHVQASLQRSSLESRVHFTCVKYDEGFPMLYKATYKNLEALRADLSKQDDVNLWTVKEYLDGAYVGTQYYYYDVAWEMLTTYRTKHDLVQALSHDYNGFWSVTDLSVPTHPKTYYTTISSEGEPLEDGSYETYPASDAEQKAFLYERYERACQSSEASEARFQTAMNWLFLLLGFWGAITMLTPDVNAGEDDLLEEEGIEQDRFSSAKLPDTFGFASTSVMTDLLTNAWICSKDTKLCQASLMTTFATYIAAVVNADQPPELMRPLEPVRLKAHVPQTWKFALGDNYIRDPMQSLMRVNITGPAWVTSNTIYVQKRRSIPTLGFDVKYLDSTTVVAAQSTQGENVYDMAMDPPEKLYTFPKPFNTFSRTVLFDTNTNMLHIGYTSLSYTSFRRINNKNFELTASYISLEQPAYFAFQPLFDGYKLMSTINGLCMIRNDPNAAVPAVELIDEQILGGYRTESIAYKDGLVFTATSSSDMSLQIGRLVRDMDGKPNIALSAEFSVYGKGMAVTVNGEHLHFGSDHGFRTFNIVNATTLEEKNTIPGALSDRVQAIWAKGSLGVAAFRSSGLRLLDNIVSDDSILETLAVQPDVAVENIDVSDQNRLITAGLAGLNEYDIWVTELTANGTFQVGIYEADVTVTGLGGTMTTKLPIIVEPSLGGELPKGLSLGQNGAVTWRPSLFSLANGDATCAQFRLHAKPYTVHFYTLPTWPDIQIQANETTASFCGNINDLQQAFDTGIMRLQGEEFGRGSFRVGGSLYDGINPTFDFEPVDVTITPEPQSLLPLPMKNMTFPTLYQQEYLPVSQAFLNQAPEGSKVIFSMDVHNVPGAEAEQKEPCCTISVTGRPDMIGHSYPVIVMATDETPEGRKITYNRFYITFREAYPNEQPSPSLTDSNVMDASEQNFGAQYPEPIRLAHPVLSEDVTVEVSLNVDYKADNNSGKIVVFFGDNPPVAAHFPFRRTAKTTDIFAYLHTMRYTTSDTELDTRFTPVQLMFRLFSNHTGDIQTIVQPLKFTPQPYSNITIPEFPIIRLLAETPSVHLQIPTTNARVTDNRKAGFEYSFRLLPHEGDNNRTASLFSDRYRVEQDDKQLSVYFSNMPSAPFCGYFEARRLQGNKTAGRCIPLQFLPPPASFVWWPFLLTSGFIVLALLVHQIRRKYAVETPILPMLDPTKSKLVVDLELEEKSSVLENQWEKTPVIIIVPPEGGVDDNPVPIQPCVLTTFTTTSVDSPLEGDTASDTGSSPHDSPKEEASSPISEPRMQPNQPVVNSTLTSPQTSSLVIRLALQTLRQALLKPKLFPRKEAWQEGSASQILPLAENPHGFYQRPNSSSSSQVRAPALPRPQTAVPSADSKMFMNT